MISRRDFLKIIGIVPVVLAVPMPKKLPEEPIVSPPTPDFTLPIWRERPDTITEDEFLFYSGTSAVSDVHIGMANAPWRNGQGLDNLP